MVTASEFAARFLLLESTGLFSSALFLFLLFAAKHCCLRWRPGRKRSKSPLIWWGQNKRSTKGVCLNGFRYFGGEPTKKEHCFFVVVDPCLDQGSLNMSILGGWSKLMLMPMYGLESLYNDPLLIYTPNFSRSTRVLKRCPEGKLFTSSLSSQTRWFSESIFQFCCRNIWRSSFQNPSFKSYCSE